MNILVKLAAIRRLSGLSQTALAGKLDVSFVSLNRWLHGKAVPRKHAQERIDALYREYTGLKEIPEEELEAKKTMLARKARRKKNVLKTILENTDIRDQFTLILTYTSNSIEGSTLTEAQTAIILFQNTTLPDKTLVEQLEAKNHQAALLYLFDHLAKKKNINEDLVLKLHGMLMNGIRQDAGAYRHHAIRIVGADLPTENYLKVPDLMARLAKDFQKTGGDIMTWTANIHARFEQIHPFSDGNGRIGRLLIHAMLLYGNWPPAVIRSQQKARYYAYLNKAQRSDDSSLLQDFLCDAVLNGWDILERRRLRSR